MTESKQYMKVEFTCKGKKHEVWGISSWEIFENALWLYVWESKEGADDGYVYIVKKAKVTRCVANNLPFAINDDETIQLLKKGK